jgi:hypothetical protein
MKTVKTLGLMVLLGVAIQLKAELESFPTIFDQDPTQAYTTQPQSSLLGTEGTRNNSTAATDLTLPNIFDQDPTQAYTTQPQSNLLGTEGTGNGSTVAAEAIKIGQSFYVPAANLVGTEGNGNTLNQTIELIGTNLSNNVKAALDTTSLDTLTKSALRLAIDNQIPILKTNLKTAYANFVATQAQKIADKVIAFNNATAETKAAAALALSSTLNAQLDTSSLIKPVNDLITIAKNTISDSQLANETTTAITNQINNDKQLIDLGNTLTAEVLPAAINAQVQQTVGSDIQTIASEFLNYVPNTTNTINAN